ncbi:Putative asparty/glutamyl-tRNA amidotransferase, subunit C [Mycoplasma haemocanis str. Illinois]|uniref:Putative asparty/glutamyl-tRNA amidotransferase, subunit C n=1 Tax=Mycoplasma haemocanis (strain Illinois) TaxID=1111676 RepID=H6N6W4_MYCHN|nr:aspartyl/glutamyl-tRNA amidotransferase subunit C [Mycoplasma haemocanis]AEW45386.1 Putative asparty/glutamyl-tRNA amidotransferase, subunit C [Mycoplasma haemocanis str. Illinois]
MEHPINDKHATFVYFGIVFVYLVALLFKKLYYKALFGRQYIIIPQPQIKSISNISMLTAMNIALIITISMISNQMMSFLFKIYPGSRFLIENILIKMGGILFGPIIGIFIGFSTDLLTVILTSSVLNYGYFLSAIMNGFFGGIINNLIRMNKTNKNTPALIAGGMTIAGLIYLGILLKNNDGGDSRYTINLLSFSFGIKWSHILLFVSGLVGIVLYFLTISTMAINRLDEEEFKDTAWVHKYAKLYEFFLIFTTNCAIYLIVDMVSLPLFDVKLSSLPYEQFLIARIFTSIPSVIVFSNIMWYIYKLHNSVKGSILVHRNNESGLMPEPEKKRKLLPLVIQ